MKHPKLNSNEVRIEIHQAVREVFKEFCSNSTIHGVQYFTKRKRHWTERCWWVIAFGLSVWLCGASVFNLWSKWQNNPVTLGLTEKSAPISAIPFPTVTICPETKALQSQLNVDDVCNLLFAGRNVSNFQFGRLKVLMHVCMFVQFQNFEFYNPFANSSLFDEMVQMAPILNETLLSCMWQYDIMSCDNLFVPILTEEGLCFAFNSLNSNEIYTNEMATEMMIVKSNPVKSLWSLESGYNDGAEDKVYPTRVYNSRQEAGLHVLLRLFERDFDYFCNGFLQGFRVILHTPGQILKSKRQSFRVPLNEQVSIIISPKLIKTSDELRTYRSDQRKCFFSSERQLRFFRIYTQNNCEAECLANFTKEQCDCVKFSMPRDVNTKMCGASNIHCYQEAEKMLYGEDVIDGVKDRNAKQFRLDCNCLASCTEIMYDATIERVGFLWEETIKAYNLSIDTTLEMQASWLTIYYKDHEVITLVRSERYTYTDFLAGCGGLFGLFLGISAISIVEFIYYLTLRLYWTLREWKSVNKVAPFKRVHINVNSVSIDMPNFHGFYRDRRY